MLRIILLLLLFIVSPVYGDNVVPGYQESFSKTIASQGNVLKLVCLEHAPVEVSAEQPPARCVLLNEAGSNKGRLSHTELALPYAHTVSSIDIDGTTGIVIEASSNRCSYKLTFAWTNETWWQYPKGAYWKPAKTTVECWR